MSEQEQSQGTLTKQKRKAFVMSPNHLFCNPDISSIAKTLWQVLESKPEGWKFFWSEILKHFWEGRNAVKNSMKELEKFGYVKKRRAKKGNIFCGMDIEVFYDPSLPFDQENQGSARVTENGSSENGSAKIGDTENRDTKKEKSKQDLSKKDSSSSMPTYGEAQKFADDEDLKIDVKKWLKFSKEGNLKNWKQAMIAYAAKPKNQITEFVASGIPPEPQEIQNIRYEIDRLFIGKINPFRGCKIEKDGSGFKAFVKDESLLKHQEKLKTINVRIICN